MDFELEPPHGAGPFRIGDTAETATDAARHLGELVVLCRTADSRPGWAVRRPSGLSIFIYFDSTGRLDAVEFGADRATAERVTYGGVPIFDTHAEEVVRQLRRSTPVAESADEPGHSFTATELGLGLWRGTVPESPEDPDGQYFESVLVARPGYWD